jgi:hypothetical protein
VARKIGAQHAVDLAALERAGFLVMDAIAQTEQAASPEKRREEAEPETENMSADADPDKFLSKDRKKINYPQAFEEFWRDYPTDPLMSKKKAYEQWRRLAAGDRVVAQSAVAGFREFCRAHPTYRPVHAQRFLSERRFDGFAGAAAPDAEAVAQAKDRADRLLKRGKYAQEFS